MKYDVCGEHWRNTKGYRVVEENDTFAHYFGGQDWHLPTCKLCKEKMHQLFVFDLTDERLHELKNNYTNELPLVSCLNCAMLWEPQVFQLHSEQKTVKVIKQENTIEWVQEDEDKLPVPLPSTRMKLIDLQEEDISTDEESHDDAFNLFGTEYVCRILGAPLLEEETACKVCPMCAKEMKYVATITSDVTSGELVSVVDFFLGEMNLYFYLCKDCLTMRTEIQGT